MRIREKKASLRSRAEKWDVPEEMVERSKGRVEQDYCRTDYLEILNQVGGPFGLLIASLGVLKKVDMG